MINSPGTMVIRIDVDGVDGGVGFVVVTGIAVIGGVVAADGHIGFGSALVDSGQLVPK